MLYPKTLIALSVLLISAVGAHAAPTSSEKAQFAQRIKSADSNHDGLITRVEFLRFRASKFDKLDRNHDGVLSESDVPRFAKNKDRGAEFGQLLHDLDLNHDRQVSRAEFTQGPTRMFDALDSDHNGALNSVELL
jgi:Ca2+-binding EF-hand superfamily protein